MIVSPVPLASPAPAAELIGRSREQAILRTRLAGLLAGHGSLVWVAGEAGIGKTTLVDWLAGEARDQGVTVVSGHCYDVLRTPPYGPWREALADPSLAGPVADPLRHDAGHQDASGQETLFAAVRAFLASQTTTRPVLLVLEDLHWAEPASLDLLRAIGRGIESLGLLLIATYRADELTRHHPLSRLLPIVVREAKAARLDLQPFTGDELETLVTSQYALGPSDQRRLTTYLQARAEGNPFYLTELLRTLESERRLQPTESLWRLEDLAGAPVPALVQQVIERRLALIDQSSRDVLTIAAVLGQQVALDLWQLVSDEAEERLVLAMDQAIAKHLVLATPGPSGIRFTHALVRDTLYQGLPLLRRRDLHRRVAEVLSDRADPPVSIVASHFSKADDARAVEWLVRAGEHALALYAARDAVAAFDQAQELAGRFQRELPVTAYRERGVAHTILSDFERARHDHEIVLQRGRATGDHAVAWQALIDLGMLWAERDYERTGSHYRAALDLARETGDELMIACSLDHIGNWHVNLDEPDLAIPLHQEALARFAAAGERQGMADCLDFLGMASFLNGDLPAATGYCERAIALYRYFDNRRGLIACLGTLSFTGGEPMLFATPMYREAAYWPRAGEEALAIARDMGWAAGEAWAAYALSSTRSLRGDLGQALADATTALAIAQRIGHRQWTIAATSTFGVFWTELLEPTRAATSFAEALALARGSGSRFWTNTMAAVLASVLVSAGETVEAAAIMDTVIPPGAPRPSRWRQYAVVGAELDLARGRPERALATIDEIIALAPALPLERTNPSLVKLRGDALRRLARPEEAAATYDAARQSAVLFGFSPILWRVELARGELYQAEGQTAKAEAAFQRARTTLEELAGSLPDDAMRAAFRERAAALIPRGTVDATGAGLSARELDVLRLLVEGQSDREIGEALSISPRTVMRHVTGILNKLGVSTRTAAASHAIRQGLV